MDEKLLSRLRDGDPAAVIEAKAWLRPIAARVLAAPQWGLGDARSRVSLEQEAVLSALRSTAEDSVGLAREAMQAGAVLGLKHLRAQEGAAPGDHAREEILVGVALQTASAAQAAVLERHLEGCTHCRRQMEQVREALRASTARVPETGSGAEEPSPTPKATPKTSIDAPRPPPRPAAPRASLRPVLLLALLCGAFAWWQAQPTDEQRLWKRAALLPTELPPTDRAERYEGDARAALLELRQGSCTGAALRLHAVWRRSPQDLWLRWYEGLAQVCARDGAAALAAFNDVKAMPEGPPFGMDWWMAQALVLDGQLDESLTLLDKLANSRHPRATQARLLAVKLRGG